MNHLIGPYAARVVTPAAVEALTWARATFERAPFTMRAFLIAGWVVLLLEGPARSDTTHVLGWPVTHTTPTTTVLTRRSRLGIQATLLFTADPQAVTFSSGMAYRNGLGRTVWAVVAPVHRWAVRSALTQASIRIGHV